jgi:hypothetical protein
VRVVPLSPLGSRISCTTSDLAPGRQAIGGLWNVCGPHEGFMLVGWTAEAPVLDGGLVEYASAP